MVSTRMEELSLPAIEISLRIPGQWSSFEAMAARLPMGCRLTETHLHLDDGMRVQWNALKADAEFPSIFAGSCERQPSSEDCETVENYTVNFCIWGPGGSLESAHAMMRAAAAILRAGGAGVFIDNSAKAHGSDDWHALTGDPEGGPFWAFVSFVGSKRDIYTTGMHVLGYRDAIIPRSGDDELDRFLLGNFLGYSYRSGAVLENGHVIAGEGVPSFRIKAEACRTVPEGTSVFNPYGMWRLERVRAEES
ncbi:MAG: hypothetical protein WD768_04525 [Phycisphaeraceae bacterium]